MVTGRAQFGARFQGIEVLTLACLLAVGDDTSTSAHWRSGQTLSAFKTLRCRFRRFDVVCVSRFDLTSKCVCSKRVKCCVNVLLLDGQET